MRKERQVQYDVRREVATFEDGTVAFRGPPEAFQRFAMAALAQKNAVRAAPLPAGRARFVER
jgi:hypothetical protein